MLKYRYCSYVIISAYNMSMFKIDKSCKLYIKVLFYFWRFACNAGAGSAMILSAVDIYKKDMKDVESAAINIMNVVIFCCSLARMNYFYIYEDKLERIVASMNEIFKHETETGMAEKSMEKYVKITKMLVYCWSFLVFFTGQFMALLPLFTIHKTGRVLPLPCWYPYDWTVSPWYELTYVTQAVTQFFMVFSYGNSDMFYMNTMILTTGQFNLLGWDFKNMIYTVLLGQGVSKDKVVEFSENFNQGENPPDINFVKAKDDDVTGLGDLGLDQEILEVISTRKFEIELRKLTAKYIAHHHMLLSLHKELEEFFSPILFTAIVLGVFYAIFMLYAIVTTTNTSLILSLVEYLATAYTSTFCLTLFGQLLTSETEKLRERLYEMPWYLCDHSFKKSFNIVQANLSKPVSLTAGKFFEMNSATYLAVVKTSFSYFAFLRQVTEK